MPYGQPSVPGPSAEPGPCSPGVYQTISGCTSFAQGTYYVTGNPTTPSGLAQRRCHGVLLFFTCSASSGATGVAGHDLPERPAARFNGAGYASHMLAAPGRSGLALVFDQGFSRSEFLNS